MIMEIVLDNIVKIQSNSFNIKCKVQYNQKINKRHIQLSGKKTKSPFEFHWY